MIRGVVTLTADLAITGDRTAADAIIMSEWIWEG